MAYRRHGAIKALGFRVPKKVAIAVLGASGLLALLGPDLSASDLVRRLNLATTCIHNIYINSGEEAVRMPAVPERGADYVPSHIKMCYEWVRQDALDVDSSTLPRMSVLEHEDICLDWTAPHYAMMEILAGSVLNTILPRIRYRHGCPTHREYEEMKRGYDSSPFQTIFQEPAMGVDRDLVFPELFLDQCKACLAQYDPASDAARVRSRAFHHCFAFPENSSMYKNPVSVSPVSAPTVLPVPSQPDPTKSSAPMSAVLRPLRARMFHSAAEWLNVTDYPPNEPNKGTVLIIDPNTIGVDPAVYDQFIDPTTTSITILAGPLCYTTQLPTGQNCVDYGEELADHFNQSFPNLDGNGFEGGPGVNFQVSGSTAGINSRATFADNLICPPRTPSCLLPVVGKKPPTESTVMAVPCPDCPGPDLPEVKFMENVGTNDNTDVVLLPDSARPPLVGTPGGPPPSPVPIPETPPDYPIAPSFPESQTPTTGDGYPDDGSPVPALVDPVDISATPSLDSYKAVEPSLPEAVGQASSGDPNERSPLDSIENVVTDHSNTERVPTPQQIQDAVDSGTPLDVNTPFNPSEEPEEPVDPTSSTELATDESAGLVSRPMSDDTYQELAVERRNSKERIVTGYDGNYLFEVPCPSADIGGAVVVDDGYAITDNGDTVIVSDGQGTVTFESPVTITTVDITEAPVTDPVTGETKVEEYSTIIDPILNEPVNITIGGVVSNPESVVEVTESVGQLVVEPSTKVGCLITGGQLNKIKKKGDKKTHTMIEGKVVSAGNENIPPSESGAIVMSEDGLAVTAQVNEFNGFLNTDPITGNSGAYQNLMQSPLQYAVQKVQVDYCQKQDFENPIYIQGQMFSMVFFDVAQTFKGSDISWVAVGFNDLFYGGDYNCEKVNEVPPGMMKNFRKSAMCEFKNGMWEAEIDIFIHDGSKIINQEANAEVYDITSRIPPSCEASNDYGNKCHFKYRVACQPGLAPPPGTRRLRKSLMTPDNAGATLQSLNVDRTSFAKNIVEQCPEIGQERLFDHFEFGGDAHETRRIPIGHATRKGHSPAKIATAFNAPSDVDAVM